MSDDVIEVRAETSDGPHRGPVIATLGWVAVITCTVVLIAVAATHEEPAWAVLFAALTGVLVMFLLGFIGAALPVRRRRLRVRAADQGLEVLGSSAVRQGEVAAAVPPLIGLVIGIVLMSRGDGSGPHTLAPLVLLGGFALATSWGAFRVITGRLPTNHVLLDRGGFALRHRGRTESFSWGDVLGFEMGSMGLTLEVRGHAGTSVTYPTAELGSDPVLVARLLEFYRAHERERSELATGRALERVRSGDF